MKENARKIKELADMNGLSNTELAVIAGVSKSTVSKWFTAGVDPRPSAIRNVANHFGVSLRYFFDENYKQPVFDCAAGDGRINGAPSEFLESEEKEGYSVIRIHGDSMFPILCDGDLVRVKHMPETTPHDLTVVKVDGETATIKYVEVTDTGIWLRAENKDAFEDKFFTVQEILSLPVTIIGKAVELKRVL